MRRHLTLLITVLAIFCMPETIQAQKSKMTLANKHYQTFDYITAGNIYRDVLSNAKYANDSLALSRIADCERKTGQLISSEGYYKQLVKIGKASGEDMRALAEVQKFQGKYAEAYDTYKMILQRFPNDDIAKKYVENPDFGNSILRDSSIYVIRNSAVNSPSSDFAPGFFTNGKFIFSSSRGNDKKDQRLYSRTQQPYLNVYLAGISPDSSLTGGEALADKVNSRYHEGTMTYDARNNTMYLTRNNFLNGNIAKAKDGKIYLGIFTAKYNTSEMTWSEIERFQHNNKEYSVGHPSLNASGNRLYFASNMPGGYGGSDLYYCEKSGEGWGSPQNLGSSINTSGDEMFPYMANDTMLYFSSTGHLGLGGLDVFYTNPHSNIQVLNAGYPLNSHFDDFSLICYTDEKYGYFSSNRPNGKGDDDIYEYKIDIDTLIVSGTVYDKETMKPLANALITVPTEDGTTLQVMTNDKGYYTIKAPYKPEIVIQGSKENYEPGEARKKPLPRSAFLENVDMQMQKIDNMAMGLVLFEENNKPAPGALVRLYLIEASDTIVIDSIKVANDGAYKFPLKKNKNYLLEATLKDYARQTHSFNTNDPNEKIHKHDFSLFKAKVGEVVRLDNIYYDYKKWDIRPDAALELNKLVQIMKDNPTMKIELQSHSDARGSDAYNLDLSDKRAKSAAAYIVSQGIAADRLYGKGYGESVILNHCKNNVKCSEEEHQYNRRTEFKITAF